MRRYALLFIIALCSSFAASAAPTARQILDGCAAKIKEAMSINASYTLTTEGHSFDGLLTLSGDRFTISSPDMMSWYDGKTQWTYSRQIGEVNIITPTPDELQQINPFAIIRSFASDYKSTVASSGNGVTTLHLTSQKKSGDIASAQITINTSTSYPTRIVLTLTSGQKVDIDIKQISKGTALPSNFFKFDKKKYPGVQVIDLR